MSASIWLIGTPGRTAVYRRAVPEKHPPYARWDAGRREWMCGCWHAYQAERCTTPSRFQDLPFRAVAQEVLQ
jgi:hypothetical protein